MSKWTLYSQSYEQIRHILHGGSADLMAYKDFTCELPISVLIDATKDELFISVTIQNQRCAYALANPIKLSIHHQIMHIIRFISAAANQTIASDISLFDPVATLGNIRNNLAHL